MNPEYVGETETMVANGEQNPIFVAKINKLFKGFLKSGFTGNF